MNNDEAWSDIVKWLAAGLSTLVALLYHRQESRLRSLELTTEAKDTALERHNEVTKDLEEHSKRDDKQFMELSTDLKDFRTETHEQLEVLRQEANSKREEIRSDLSVYRTETNAKLETVRVEQNNKMDKLSDQIGNLANNLYARKL